MNRPPSSVCHVAEARRLIIAEATTASATPDSLHRSEAGMLSIVNALTVFFFTVLIVFMFNAARVVVAKIETQNGADAVAYTTAVWDARGLNALGAIQHTIGELMSFVCIHDAVKTAVAEAKEILEPMLEDVQRDKARAYELMAVPETAAAGAALLNSARAREAEILDELRRLEGFLGIATSLDGSVELIREEIVPDARDYCDVVVEAAPRLGRAAAREVAKLNGVEGEVFPIDHQLPVMIDPFAKVWSVAQLRELGGVWEPSQVPSGLKPAVSAREQAIKVTQLARATFPWVNYHREPILAAIGDRFPLTDFQTLYFDHTNGSAKRICDEAQRADDGGLALYVLKGTADPDRPNFRPPDRGYEDWADARNSWMVDELFTVAGMARRQSPQMIGSSMVFDEFPTEGMYAVSQALLYHANPQQQAERRINLATRRIIPTQQANVGWDTLNWISEENGRGPSELIGIGTPHDYPRIRVNWQVKLTPTTPYRLAQIRDAVLPGSFAEIASWIGKTAVGTASVSAGSVANSSPR